MARLVSVNVGLPRNIKWKGRTVHTGIWKNPVRCRCRVGRLNIHGDGQGDLAGHGGEQRAVFVYQVESYQYWQEQLNRADFVHGQLNGGECTTPDVIDAAPRIPHVPADDANTGPLVSFARSGTAAHWKSSRGAGARCNLPSI